MAKDGGICIEVTPSYCYMGLLLLGFAMLFVAFAPRITLCNCC